VKRTLFKVNHKALLTVFIVILLIGSSTSIQIAHALEDWQPETMTNSLGWGISGNDYFISVHSYNIVWDQDGVGALYYQWITNHYRYTHDTHDRDASAGRLSASSWYSTNFPNPVFDRDDDNFDGKNEEAEITMNSIPTAGTQYYARYRYWVMVEQDFTARIQISDQLSFWLLGWQTVYGSSHVRENLELDFNYPDALYTTHVGDIFPKQEAYTNKGNDISITKQVLEQNWFNSFIKYQVVEVSHGERRHIEVNTINVISSINDFQLYKTSMDNYLYVLDYLISQDYISANEIDVVITFNNPIGLSEYNRLIDLGVNITSFECRAIDANGTRHTIGGSPKFMSEILSADEVYQKIIEFATSDNCIPLGITSMEAKISRDILDTLNNESFVLLVDIIPAILKSHVSIYYSIQDIDVNLNDLYWIAEELGII